MLPVKEIATAVGTLACAVGIGFIMQSSDTAKARYGADAPTPVAPSVVEPEDISTSDVLDVQAITLTSALTESGVVDLVPDAAIKLAAATQSLESPAPVDLLPKPACEITATGEAVADAMMRVTLAAACLPNERVNVHHLGMIFTDTTDRDGNLSLTIPAMTADAVVIFAFPSGDGAVAEVAVPDLEKFNRTALQWRGDAGFEIHARELGADYGQPGHVWSGTPKAIGQLTQLGNRNVPEAFMVEVYSFPRDMGLSEGIVDLTVEAEVTAANCGQEIEAQSLEITESGIKTQDLTLAVPECEARGDFLVLNNLVQDMKVAGN